MFAFRISAHTIDRTRTSGRTRTRTGVERLLDLIAKRVRNSRVVVGNKPLGSRYVGAIVGEQGVELLVSPADVIVCT